LQDTHPKRPLCWLTKRLKVSILSQFFPKIEQITIFQDAQVKARLKEVTDEAVRRGAFGAYVFIVV